MYPCPCGCGDAVKECTCSSSTITRYQKRISGPLLDRIDIHIEVPRVEYEKLSDCRVGEPSEVIRARIESARARQRERFSSSAITQSSITKSPNGLACNADMGPAHLAEALQYRPKVGGM